MTERPYCTFETRLTESVKRDNQRDCSSTFKSDHRQDWRPDWSVLFVINHLFGIFRLILNQWKHFRLWVTLWSLWFFGHKLKGCSIKNQLKSVHFRKMNNSVKQMKLIFWGIARKEIRWFLCCADDFWPPSGRWN